MRNLAYLAKLVLSLKQLLVDHLVLLVNLQTLPHQLANLVILVVVLVQAILKKIVLHANKELSYLVLLV